MLMNVSSMHLKMFIFFTFCVFINSVASVIIENNERSNDVEPREIYLGKCNDDEALCSWTLDNTTGRLTISGTGDMTSHGWISYKSFIGTVTINDGIKSIGESAFSWCTELTSINIPNSVTSIGDGAFKNCPNLDFNEYDNALYLGNENNPYVALVKAQNTSITSCEINENCRFIYDYAFQRCEGLTLINIPNSVTSIGGYAFAFCTGLTSINIPNSVTSIGGYAFASCTGLTSINISNSVTSIGKYAFYNCPNPDFNKYDNALYLGNENNPYVALVKAQNTSITSCEINENCRFILEDAFDGCEGLTLINIPNSVTSIGYDAFYVCTGLTSVNIGNSVTSIGGYAFASCTELTSINIPNSVTSIGYCAFEGCTGLTSVNIGNSVTSIGVSAFYECSGLTSINIGNSVTSIGDSAFYGCTGLTSINIPNSVTSIGRSAFKNCPNLDFNKYDNALYLGNENNPYVALIKAQNTSITSCEIYENCRFIYDYAFDGCEGLTLINIPNSVTSIGGRAFADCDSLIRVIYHGTSGPSSGEGVFNGMLPPDICVPVTYNQDTSFCEKSISFNSGNYSHESDNPCYSFFVCCNGTSNYGYYQRSVNASDWESKSNDCNKYYCADNTTKTWSKCSNSNGVVRTCNNNGQCEEYIEVNDKGRAVQIEVDNFDLSSFNETDFILTLQNSTKVGSDKISVSIDTNEEGRIMRIIIFVDEDVNAQEILNVINECNSKSSIEREDWHEDCPYLFRYVKNAKIITSAHFLSGTSYSHEIRITTYLSMVLLMMITLFRIGTLY